MSLVYQLWQETLTLKMVWKTTREAQLIQVCLVIKVIIKIVQLFNQKVQIKMMKIYLRSVKVKIQIWAHN